MAGDEALVMTSLVITFAFFAKEKEFYSANEAYVSLLEGGDG